MGQTEQDYMEMALAEARSAGEEGEVPVGAVVVGESGDILTTARNRTIEHADPTAHAEILALRQTGKVRGNYRLLNTTLYVTVEPCIMCMGAIVHARVSRVVFGANDPKWGAAGSLYHFAEDKRLNHRPEVYGGVCEDACKALIQGFFRAKRQ
ncbi:MAG: tRNA adenosine(34) deaminase TadA [Desulfobacterales bacterium]